MVYKYYGVFCMHIPEKSPDMMCGMLTAFSVLALAIILAIGRFSPFLLQMSTTDDDLIISRSGPLHTSSKSMHAAIVTQTLSIKAHENFWYCRS